MAKWNTNWANFPGLMLVTTTLILAGCATPFFGGYGAKDQSSEDCKPYVEGVFRLQNSMTSEIMALLETDDEKNHDALLEAEQHMQEACGTLNEYASRESEGLNIVLFLRLCFGKSAIDCEQAALNVKSLLGH